MDPESTQFLLLLDGINLPNRYMIIEIIYLALLYGIYLCLFPIAVHAMVTNGLQSRARKWLLATITCSFVLITAFWICSVLLAFSSFDSMNNIVTACYDKQYALDCAYHELNTLNRFYLRLSEAMKYIPLLSEDILLINLIIADGVVVWRAWVLSDQSRIILTIPVVMLAINAVIYLVKVMVRVIEIIPNHFNASDQGPLLERFIDFLETIPQLELTQLTLSLVINIYATSIIGLKAWKHRKLLMESGIGVRTPRQAIKILALLVESGVIYVLISVTSLASVAILIHFQREYIASLIFLLGVHLAGIYPIAVVLLVEKNRSLDTTYCSFGTISDIRGDRPPQTECRTLAPELMLASGGKIDPTTKPLHHDTDNHVTFDSAR